MKLFEDMELTATEMKIVKDALSLPAVVKYIRGLAQAAAADMATSADRVVGQRVEDAHIYQVKNAFVQGNVSALGDLLDIAVVETPST